MARRPATRQSTRANRGVNDNSLSAFDERVSTPVRGGGALRRAAGGRGVAGRFAKGRGRVIFADALPAEPLAAPKAGKRPATSPVNPFTTKSKRATTAVSQAEVTAAQARYLQEIAEARKRLERELDGEEDKEEEDEGEGEDPYHELTPATRGRLQRLGLSTTPRGARGRSRQTPAETPDVGPPRTRGYDGRPLSDKMLRLEIAKKDYQRELARRARETPETLDAQEFMEEEYVDARVNRDYPFDYVMQISLKVWVNKFVALSKGMGDHSRSSFSEIWTLVEQTALQAVVDKCDGEEEEIISRVVVVKSMNGRGTNQRNDFDDFSVSSMDDILRCADSEYHNFPRSAVRLMFEVKTKCDALTELGVKKKRTAITPNPVAAEFTEALSNSPAPATPIDDGRRTRSTNLREDNNIRRWAGMRDRVNFRQSLMNTWTCWDPNCPNSRNYCFYNQLERPGLHFKIDGADFDTWASALERSDAGVSLQSPPEDRKKYWYETKGPVSRDGLTSGRPTVTQRFNREMKSAAQQMADYQEMVAQMMMQEQMSRLQERMEERERRKDEREERERRRREDMEELEYTRRMERTQSHPHVPANYAQRQPPMIRPAVNPLAYAQPPPTPLVAPAPPIQAHIHVPPPAYSQTRLYDQTVALQSSPIDTAKDEYDIVEEFFDWVIAGQGNAARQHEWKLVKEQATANFWTLEDLKSMAQPSSELYRLATKEYHIPDGIARSFKRYLSRFKPVYRKKQEDLAAGALVDMQIGPGGLIRSG